MSIKDKVISNSIYLFLFRFSDTILFMLFWLILGKILSPSAYGVIAVSLQIVAFLSGMSMLGLGMTTNKLIPEFIKKNEKKKLNGLIQFSLKATTITAILLSTIFVIGSTAFPGILNLEPTILLTIGVSTIFLALISLLMNIYFGFQNMRKVFITTFIGYMLMVILTIAFIPLNLGYFGPLAAYVISNGLILLMRIQKKFLRRSNGQIVDKKLIFRYAKPAFIVIILSLIFNNTQFILLSIMKTTEITGIFAVSMKIAFVLSVPAIMSRAIFPIISELSVDSNPKVRQSYLISLVFRYGAFMIIPMVAFMMIFPEQLVLFFSTAEYLSAIKFLPILIVSGGFLGLSYILLSSLYAIGRPKEYRNSYVISTIVYLPLAGILTYYFSAIGLSIAYMISSFTLFLTSFIFIKRKLPLKIPLNDILKMLMAVFISSIFLWLVEPLTPNIFLAAPFIVVALLMYSAILLKVNFYLEEDLMILDFLIGFTSKFRKEIKWFRNHFAKFIRRSYK